MKTTISLTAKKFLDNVHGLIVVLSEKGTVEFINQYAAQLLGYEREFIIGKNWFDHFVPADQRKKTKKQFADFVKGKDSVSNLKEQYVETKEGELHLVEWHNTFLQDRQKNTLATFSSGEDITEKYFLKLYLADQQAKYRQDRLSEILEAAERERKFLSYELHDGVNQVLTTCKLYLESEINSGNQSQFVERSFKLIQEVINNLRELSHELNPAELGNEGLYNAAQELVSRINAAGKIEVKTQINGIDYLKNLCPQISLSLYRIIQEALTNIIKHAKAQKVTIRLVSSPCAVDMEIEDDGQGFDRANGKIGLGLKSIYTRAEAAGGKAYIETSPCKGTLLSVHVPIEGNKT